MLAYTRGRGIGGLGYPNRINARPDPAAKAAFEQAYDMMAAAALSVPDIVAHGGKALLRTSNAQTRVAYFVAAGTPLAEAQMVEKDRAKRGGEDGSGWWELYNATPAASSYPMLAPRMGDVRYTLDDWWDSGGVHFKNAPALTLAQDLAAATTWAAQQSAAQGGGKTLAEQALAAAAETKPGQSVPPSPQAGEVPAVGSGTAVKIDTSAATGEPAAPAAETGFDWSALFTTQNLLIGGAVLVGLFVVMGMGKGRG